MFQKEFEDSQILCSEWEIADIQSWLITMTINYNVIVAFHNLKYKQLFNLSEADHILIVPNDKRAIFIQNLFDPRC